MPAPPNEYSYDFDAVERASEHWRTRGPMRAHNRELLDQKRYTEVESKDRLAQRANRLLQKVKTSVARRETAAAAPEGLSEDLNDLVKLGPIEEEDVTDDLMERVIGETRDFLSVEFLEKGLKVNRCVGRVVTALGGGRRSFGTGFMVSPRLLLTNWHVLKRKETAAASTVEFDYQLDFMGNALTPQRFKLNPAAFFLNDQNLDFALVAVEERSSQNHKLDFGWCQLIKEEGKAILGNPVNIIQHPLGEMKQVIIRENKLVDLPPEPLDRFAHYEGDTEPGSSGSPVFNDQWEVIALHHSGVPKTDEDGNMIDIDGGIWRKGDDPSRLKWVANEGIRVSRLVEFVTQAKVAAHEEALREQLIDPGASPNPVNVKPPEEEEDIMEDKDEDTKVHFEDASGGRSITISVPLNITISLGSPSSAGAIVPAPKQPIAPNEDLLEKITPEKNYDERPGYDPDFLGFNVPMPDLDPSIRELAVKVPGSGHELKYHHYSVIMRGDRRLAFVAGVNFEGDAKVNYPRDKDGDRWFFDPRIPKEKQVGEELYAGNPLDRGHLVRRADAAWGDTKQDAKIANDDTFHFTNCSPQHEVFNQSTKANKKGVLLWGNIEDHIASQGKANRDRLAVFNGPIFRTNDRKHRGVRVPKEFWKVVVFKGDNGNPKALAFILSQASLIKTLPAEEFEVGPYEPFQVRIRDLESKTKLDFGSLRNHDPLEDEENESVFESGTEIVPLENLENIVY